VLRRWESRVRHTTERPPAPTPSRCWGCARCPEGSVGGWSSGGSRSRSRAEQPPCSSGRAAAARAPAPADGRAASARLREILFEVPRWPPGPDRSSGVGWGSGSSRAASSAPHRGRQRHPPRPGAPPTGRVAERRLGQLAGLVRLEPDVLARWPVQPRAGSGSGSA
jgi:hypothetical protein